jgi:hypothetical protein
MKMNLEGMKKHDLTQFMQRQSVLAMEKAAQDVAVQILHSAAMVPKDAAALDRITKALVTPHPVDKMVSQADAFNALQATIFDNAVTVLEPADKVDAAVPVRAETIEVAAPVASTADAVKGAASIKTVPLREALAMQNDVNERCSEVDTFGTVIDKSIALVMAEGSDAEARRVLEAATRIEVARLVNDGSGPLVERAVRLCDKSALTSIVRFVRDDKLHQLIATFHDDKAVADFLTDLDDQSFERVLKNVGDEVAERVAKIDDRELMAVFARLAEERKAAQTIGDLLAVDAEEDALVAIKGIIENGPHGAIRRLSDEDLARIINGLNNATVIKLFNSSGCDAASRIITNLPDRRLASFTRYAGKKTLVLLLHYASNKVVSRIVAGVHVERLAQILHGAGVRRVIGKLDGNAISRVINDGGEHLARSVTELMELSVPVVENLPKQIIEAAPQNLGPFDFGFWFRKKVIALAGPHGKALEDKLYAEVAGDLIYVVSTGFEPPHRYVPSHEALAFVERAAKAKAPENAEPEYEGMTP